MRDHLATLLDDFRRFDRQIAVVRFQGNRRRATTYGQIAHLAGRFAALLALRGIGPGDRVLLWGENGAEWIAAFHGSIARGVLVVPLDAYGTAEFAARVAADVQPKLAVGDALLLRQLPPEYSRLAFEDWPGALPSEEAGPVAGLSRETPLQILFTSGTTGDPKGVVLTHGNILASVEPIERGAQPYMFWERLLAHPLRIFDTLPLSHVFGQTMGLWVPPIFAAEVHFENRLVASRLIETIKHERISVLAAVPRVMALLKTHLEVSHSGLQERIAASEGTGAWTRWWRFRDVHSEFGLKFWALISGGGALGGPLEHFWNALGFVMVQGYGMTETSALITLNHPFHVAHGTIGKPMAGREVKLGPDGEVLVRGAAISGGSWRNGAFQPREDEWLATGDLAEVADSGELRFLGRKSEVIVTSSGVNLHPEDLEAAIEQEPDVAACAVVAMETAAGPEPCAVLAMRGHGEHAAALAIENGNRRLAEFQRLRHWMLWPEPDLPRTSTGKVRRKVVAAWLAQIQAASAAGDDAKVRASAIAQSSDWLLALIAGITGETPSGTGDELRLTEDLQLDSLGRVQLAAALEERLGVAPESGLLERAETLGDLRALVACEPDGEGTRAAIDKIQQKIPDEQDSVIARIGSSPTAPVPIDSSGIVAEPTEHEPERHIYPHWPWLLPFQWLRVAFIEAVAQPLVWLLANPRVVAPAKLGLASGASMLIIANHVSTFDGPLVLYALPGRVRRRIAVAMAADMLADYRHFRNPERPAGRKSYFFLPGPVFYWLLTALYNVFPLPRRRNFQQSFAHAGAAMDHGYNVLVFPEGTRSAEGTLARFRGGIGLLAKQSGAQVLPVALCGLGELKAENKRWFRSGSIEVHVGQPIRFAPEETEATITARLHSEVERLLGACN
jgi:long-chain acyl-CoA synthetase